MKKTVLIIIGFLIFVGIYFKINKESYRGVVDKNDNVPVDFIINKGEGSTEVGERLAKEGLVKNKYYFWYYVWRTKTDSKLQAGPYILSKNMTIPEMVYKFTKGDIKDEKNTITVPEGYSNDKIVAVVAKVRPDLEKDFREIVNCRCLNEVNCACDLFSEKYDFIRQIPRGLTLEGYLFPDTYFLAKNEKAEDLVNKFLKNFQQKVDGDIRKEIERQGKSLHEVITLASIVEREVKEDKDRPIVAGIFWKRLELGMPLGSDATLSYILKTDKVKYTQNDIEAESPYNTYKFAGLPPGPISNPGLKAILAVVHPQKTDYLYFLNNAKTGETVFSKTGEEHSRNKRVNGL